MMLRGTGLVVSCLRNSFSASYNGPVTWPKRTEPPIVMVLAYAEHHIEMTEVGLDPVADSNKTCRVTVPTSCAEEGYVVTISIFDLCARLLATRVGRLMQMGICVSGIDERFWRHQGQRSISRRQCRLVLLRGAISELSRRSICPRRDGRLQMYRTDVV